jgi:GntR family transcriptional regulator/MocR family aminotransferase
MRYPVTLTIPIELAPGPAPLYEQIASQVGTAIEEGRLATGAVLPSTRSLGVLLGVSRGVVATAYDLLAARGYLQGRAGSGSFVVGPAAAPRRATAPASPPAGLVDLRPGGPGPDLFPVRDWRAAWRRASFAPPPAHPPPALGLPELRRAIAGQLRVTRGMALAGSEVVVTAGTAAGLRLVLDALGLAGSEVAIEEPGPRALRQAVPAGSGEPVALPVDADGARIGSVPPDCRALVLSPDAHEPLGCVLSADRRRQVAGWAAATGGRLVEVACDAVFRPQACRLPALSGLAGAAAVTVGGFGALASGLGLGYVVVPAGLTGRLRRLIADRAGQPAHLLQRAVAELLARGTVTRLMHRLGQAHRAKRRLVEAALRPVGRLAGLGAVGTVVLYLPGGQEGGYAARALRDRGVRVRALADYHVPGELPAPARSGLVVGYGHLPDPALRAGLAALARELPGLA